MWCPAHHAFGDPLALHEATPSPDAAAALERRCLGCGAEKSLWLHAQKVEPVRAPALRGHHSADLAIIGGGITGCAAAHQLASAGARVVLIEAARIGRGSTAASTALLMQEPDADFGELAGRYGPFRGARHLGSEPAGGAEPDQDVESAARRAAGRVPSLDLLHAARGAGPRAEEGARGATSGRGRRRMADAGGTTSRGRFRRSRRDPHTRQRAGRSVRRLYGIRAGRPAGRRTAARAHTGASDPAARRRRRGRYRPRPASRRSGS